MERLVDEKVDTFWKGIDLGTEKKGQVSLRTAENCDLQLTDTSDHSDILGEEAQEVMVSSVYGRGAPVLNEPDCLNSPYIGRRRYHGSSGRCH
jgi:hypothetical protein